MRQALFCLLLLAGGGAAAETAAPGRAQVPVPAVREDGRRAPFQFQIAPGCGVDPREPDGCPPPSRNLMRRHIAEVRAAAEAGSAYDQFVLGFVHWMGRRAPYDPVRARMWFELAAEGGHKGAVWALAALDRELSSADRAAAARLADTWRARRRD